MFKLKSATTIKSNEKKRPNMWHTIWLKYNGCNVKFGLII